jgi:hypothetical protein
MSISEIITDSLTYPLSSWIKFLFLGIIILISFSPFTVSLLINLNFLPFVSLTILGLVVVGSLVSGYLLKIISESLGDVNKLPELNDWKKMFTNGFKVLVINFIYLIPIFMIIISLLRYPLIETTLITNLTILPYSNLGLMTSDVMYALIHFIFALLYLIVITPVILMSVANVAYNNGKFSAAFKFKEIFTNISNLSWDNFTWGVGVFYYDLIPVIIGFFILDEIIEIIHSIGWKKLIIWYISTGVTFFIISIVGCFIANITSILVLNSLNLYSVSNYHILLVIILSLVLIPYLLIFLSRSTALVYNSAIKSYLIRESDTNYQLNQYG